MKIQVPQEVFDTVKQQFLQLDLKHVDSGISDTLQLFKDSPVLDKVVPRWSCQGHSDQASDNSFYIIFCTVDDGDDFLHEMWNRITLRLAERHSVGYLAGTCLNVVNLMMCTVDKDGVYQHLQLESVTNGNPDVLKIMQSIWKEVFEELEKEHYEL